jgi:phosphoserine phosphatase
MTAHAGISIPCRAEPVVREQASYALNFVGLVGLLNLLVSQQIACLTFYLCA